MFGSVGHWFYTELAGLTQPADSYGYDLVIFKPRPSAMAFGGAYFGALALPKLSWAKASTQTVRGLASISWESRSKEFSLNCTAPVGSSAVVYLPVPPGAAANELVIAESGTTIFSGGEYEPGPAGVVSAALSDGDVDGQFVVVNVGSGSYQFVLTQASIFG